MELESMPQTNRRATIGDRVTVSLTLSNDHLNFLRLVMQQKGYGRSQTVEYVIDTFIKMLQKKAGNLQQAARQQQTEKKNMEETIYRYQQGKPIKEKIGTEKK